MNKTHVYFLFTPTYILVLHMSTRIFTPSVQQQLRNNPNVASCTAKSITYTKEFKEYALYAYQTEYRNAKEIFVSSGFDLDVIGHDIPHQCIARWQRYGIAGTRGRPKQVVFTTLEAELAYLKAENAFLKQLRAQRAEKYSSRNNNTRSSTHVYNKDTPS